MSATTSGAATCSRCSMPATCRRRRAPRRRSWPRRRPSSAAPAPTRRATPSSASDQLVSRSTIDAQNAAAAAAQAQVNAARANLDVAGNQAAYTQLRAPSDGVIAARSAEAGQVVGAGQPVFTLAADGEREVAFAVPEGAVTTLKPGQPVQVELWSQPGQRWPGTRARDRRRRPTRPRAPTPRASPSTRRTTRCRLGQSARVYLPQHGNGGLSVPLSALQRSNGGVAVFVVDAKTSTLKLQPVEVGAYGEDRAPVKRGLERDDWVVAAGGHLLRDGAEGDAGRSRQPPGRGRGAAAATAAAKR